jgi:imidazolonepropionase-like amidohydrolase
MNKLLLISAAISMTLGATSAVAANQTLINNVNVFDGKSDSLLEGAYVLVEDDLIKSVSTTKPETNGDAVVIDGKGGTLMPGLSDTHVHIAFASIPQQALLFGDPGYAYIHSTVDAEAMLMRGVTSVRDMGGNTFGLKMAIDQGLVKGPRIYPSGAMLGQTAGHSDFRMPNQQHYKFGGHRAVVDVDGHGRIVDGVPDMLSAVRENLRHGASHIKLAAGGGYSSPADPLTGNQLTFDEIKAAVDAAKDWGTYVTVHAYHPSSINRAIDAGVKDIGHGQLLDKATLKKMASKGVFLSTQPFTECSEPQLDAVSNAKLNQVCKGTVQMYKTAKSLPKLKVTYGTDLFFVSKEMFAEQVKMMERLLDIYEPVDILRMATSNSGELFAMSGELRNPYQKGPLGVIQEGAYADLLVVNGNPLKSLDAITNTENLKIIMKDGVIYKNTLE